MSLDNVKTPQKNLTVVTDVEVCIDEAPKSIVRVRSLQWRGDQDDALRSILKHHVTRRGGRKADGEVTFWSPGCSPAQLKQAVMTVITGTPAPLEPEDPKVVKTIWEYVNTIRHLEAQESHRLLTLASLMKNGGEYDVDCSCFEVYGGRRSRIEFRVLHHLDFVRFTEGDDVSQTVRILERRSVSRKSILKASIRNRRPWFFKGEGAWWLNL
jgi:hypothetical protein